jgi:hypothetical protein
MVQLASAILASFTLVSTLLFVVQPLFVQQSALPNLYPRMSDFQITAETFSEEDDAVLDECIDPGEHRLLRFSLSVANRGNADAYIGNPEDNPQHFVWSNTHGHYHVARFNEYRFLNEHGVEVTEGFKQGFCMIDIVPLNARRPAPSSGYTCENQGISAGWADLYDASLPCQFIDLKGVGNGTYILEVRTNAQRIIPESSFADNVARVRLRIEGDSVTLVIR